MYMVRLALRHKDQYSRTIQGRYGWHPADSQQGNSSCNHKKIESTKNLNKPGRTVSPRASR